VSATGAVLLEPPPPGTKWRHEEVPHVDAWPAEEAIEALNADVWHETGATGAGVKVAVFDLQWFGSEADPDVLGDVETHDCWASPTCEPAMDTFLPRFSHEEGVHGYGCAQVVRDVAPDAEIHLVRVNGETTLENAVDWAIREGVDVVSMSLSFFNTSFYDGTGPVNGHMDRLAAAGVLMVASSGNYARGHWMGPYTDGNDDGRMDLDGEDGLWVHLGTGSARGIYVSWNQFRYCGLTDLDVWLRDEAGNVIGRSDQVQSADADSCAPVERLSGYVEEEGWYRLEIVQRAGPVANLSVNVLVTDGSVLDSMAEGSMTDPSSHPAVLGVGAVRADGYLWNEPEGFSSRGPTSDGRPKPDIAGPDGLSTDAYGPVGFYGTSAATPAVAGAVALVLSDDPTLTPFEAARHLEGWALGDSATFESPDPRWGAGKARLPVRDGAPSPCGERPLLLPLFLLPVRWLRRRAGGRVHS
jgi:hypothetical protein